MFYISWKVVFVVRKFKLRCWSARGLFKLEMKLFIWVWGNCGAGFLPLSWSLGIIQQHLQMLRSDLASVPAFTLKNELNAELTLLQHQTTSSGVSASHQFLQTVCDLQKVWWKECWNIYFGFFFFFFQIKGRNQPVIHVATSPLTCTKIQISAQRLKVLVILRTHFFIYLRLCSLI